VTSRSPVRLADPIKPKNEKHGPGEGPPTLDNHGPPPPAHVRVVLLVALLLIRRQEQRANPANRVVQQQYDHRRHQAYRHQRHQRDAQQDLLLQWQLAASHRSVHVMPNVRGEFLLELFEALVGDGGGLGLEKRAVIFGRALVVCGLGSLWRLGIGFALRRIEVFEFALHVFESLESPDNHLFGGVCYGQKNFTGRFLGRRN
jgi:hypothetical protein